ncbi:MAG: hypothetical protein QME77_12185 [bacterium]|nr:hypothetical protein [bacterium]
MVILLFGLADAGGLALFLCCEGATVRLSRRDGVPAVEVDARRHHAVAAGAQDLLVQRVANHSVAEFLNQVPPLVCANPHDLTAVVAAYVEDDGVQVLHAGRSGTRPGALGAYE